MNLPWIDIVSAVYVSLLLFEVTKRATRWMLDTIKNIQEEGSIAFNHPLVWIQLVILLVLPTLAILIGLGWLRATLGYR